MFKALIKVSNRWAVDTCCPAFFTQKIDHFLRFSDDTKKDRKTRKTNKKEIK